MRRPLTTTLALTLLLTACGGAPVSAPESETVDLMPRPAAAVRYEIQHREARQVDDEPATSIVTRILLEVTEVLPDGARRGRARLYRTDSDNGEDVSLIDSVVDFELSPTGELVGEPDAQCGEEGDLRLARYLRHVLGTRAIVARAVGVGARWRGALFSDATELPAQATFRLDTLTSTTASGRLSAPLVADEGDIGPVRVTGDGRVRGRFVVSLRDGFEGTTDLRTQIEGTIRIGSTERQGVVQTRSRVRVRRVQPDATLTLSCDFDPSTVTDMIRARVPVIRGCFERELVSDPLLNGRVLVRFTVMQSGRLTRVHVTENTTGREAVGACIVDALRDVRLRPGPVGGSVSFAYPFVFAPQN